MSAQNILSQTSPPPQNVYTSMFFKWKICFENDKRWNKMFKVNGIWVFSIDTHLSQKYV